MRAAAVAERLDDVAVIVAVPDEEPPLITPDDEIPIRDGSEVVHCMLGMERTFPALSRRTAVSGVVVPG